MMEKKMNWRDIKESQKFWGDKGVKFDSFFKTKVNTKNTQNNEGIEGNVITNYNIPLPDDNFSIDEVHEVTGDGSITPTTHIHEHTVFLDQNKAMFATRYAYEKKDGGLQSDVVRFGINVSNINTNKNVHDHNKSISFSPYDLKDLSSVIQKNITAKAYSKNNSYKKLKDKKAQEQFLEEEKKKLITEQENKIKEYKNFSKQNLTKIELEILLKSIEFLKNNNVKTVIIDIFARANKDGQYEGDHKLSGKKYNTGDIKYEKDGNIETHSVVLFKHNNKYLVIDPSNAEFSNILIAGHDDVSVCLSKKFQVYKPDDNNNIGPSSEQWRDCIDIAVKLAFNINTSKHDIKINKFGIIEYDSLKNDQSIQEVSNNPTLYKKIPDELIYNFVRAKQTSDIKYQKLLSEALKLYVFVKEKTINLIKEIDLKYDSNNLEGSFLNLCKTEYKPSNYQYTYNSLVQIVNSYLEETEKEMLLGALETNIDKYIVDNIGG